MTRLNITLPDEIAKKISKKQNKSRFIAEALREKLDRERRVKIEHLLREGYKNTSGEDAEIVSDWAKIDLEGWDE